MFRKAAARSFCNREKRRLRARTYQLRGRRCSQYHADIQQQLLDRPRPTPKEAASTLQKKLRTPSHGTDNVGDAVEVAMLAAALAAMPLLLLCCTAEISKKVVSLVWARQRCVLLQAHCAAPGLICNRRRPGGVMRFGALKQTVKAFMAFVREFVLQETELAPAIMRFARARNPLVLEYTTALLQIVAVASDNQTTEEGVPDWVAQIKGFRFEQHNPEWCRYVNRELSGGTGMSPGAYGGYYDDQGSPRDDEEEFAFHWSARHGY
ncbi:unnamed protein product [Durusdinium trenchii]|uniref:Uncharacterized protein n=1 Tax=Durusdinium trenchii TaxID=1381693 RepID=A0ABP0Q4E1_9DINO